MPQLGWISNQLAQSPLLIGCQSLSTEFPLSAFYCWDFLRHVSTQTKYSWVCTHVAEHPWFAPVLVLRLHRKRKIRGNQLLPLYSMSNLSLLLDALCCLQRGEIHQRLGKMTCGRKKRWYTKTFPSAVDWNVLRNLFVWCLVENKWKKNSTYILDPQILKRHAL